ncbi:LptF/LptG family permease [Pelagibacterales bacterium SAG-MED28]|nr:LptF/LptG family permease [Pelagibacterales bacterium SAG-MED28]|tara:strand:- start:291 stop:1400 length:1110 start_codon:yes stop_codon:yes gene_type:complete
MLQNKIYNNYLLEILKTFLTIVFGLSIIAFTVRAVNFLELIVDSGYSLSIYFQYSILNIFGLAPKFFPLAFLVSIAIFIIKHNNNSEFIILWTAGVKKIKITNLLLYSSLIVTFFYFIFSIYLTPLALNKSRYLLSQSQYNSFLPTVRPQQFSDSFKGLTFFVEKKINNEIKNIFLHDTSNNLKNFSSSVKNVGDTSIIAEKGFVNNKSLFLINGQIISHKKNSEENELITFSELNIDLNRLNTTVIKDYKLQETSTFKLLNCFINKNIDLKICDNETKKEIIPILIRRIILPLYIPVISLICSFLLFKKKNFFSNQFFIFIYSFILLILLELIIKYTGTNALLRSFFLMMPVMLFISLYPIINHKSSK